MRDADHQNLSGRSSMACAICPAMRQHAWWYRSSRWSPRVLVGQFVGEEAHPSVEAPRPRGIVEPRSTLAPYVDDEPALTVVTAEWPARIVGKLNAHAVPGHEVCQVVSKRHEALHARRELAL